MDAGGRKRQVGVRVHEAGHHDASGGVDLDRVARLGEILDAPAGSHFHQNAVANEDGTVLNHVEFIE